MSVSWCRSRWLNDQPHKSEQYPLCPICAFFETWRFPAQNIITNCSQCEVPRRTAAGMEPVQKDHATVNFPGCKALPREAPIA